MIKNPVVGESYWVCPDIHFVGELPYAPDPEHVSLLYGWSSYIAKFNSGHIFISEKNLFNSEFEARLYRLDSIRRLMNDYLIKVEKLQGLFSQ